MSHNKRIDTKISKVSNFMTLGQKISRRLKELGLTQNQAARQAILTQSAISKYIRNKGKPSYEAIAKLAEVLDVDHSWFFHTQLNPTLASTRDTATVVPSAHVVDQIVFPLSGQAPQRTKFTIGHFLPMRQLPPPMQAKNTGVASNFYKLIFNALAEYRPDGSFRGVLAMDWKPSGNSWLFRIRPGVIFHDGQPLTVEDIRWSYEQYLKSNVQECPIERIEVIDESVIALHLTSPLHLDEVAKPLIMPAGMDESPAQWIGTGPFQATELNADFWRLEANPYYILGRPFFNELHLRTYETLTALEKAMRSGEVDFGINTALDTEGFTVKTEAAVQRYHLHFLLNRPLGSDRLLRQAISTGLDRTALARVAGIKNPRYSSGPFDYLLKDSTSQPPFHHDPQIARQLLKQVKGLSDQVFRVKCYTGTFKETILETELVSQLKGLGIPTQVHEPPEVDAMLVSRNVHLFDVESKIWYSESPSAWNISRYKNKAVDELLIVCRREGITEEHLRELRQLIQQDLPDIALFFDEQSVTYVEHLRAIENRMILLSNLHEIHTWYLDQKSDMGATKRTFSHTNE